MIDPTQPRLAPALACSAVSRIIRLRLFVKELSPAIQRALEPFLAPLAFEKELLSGKLAEVNRALTEADAETEAHLAYCQAVYRLRYEQFQRAQIDLTAAEKSFVLPLTPPANSDK